MRGEAREKEVQHKKMHMLNSSWWFGQVSGIVEQIVKFGKVTRPVLGISFAPEQSVEQLGVSGVLVLDAPPTGPAGKAVSLLISSLSSQDASLM